MLFEIRETRAVVSPQWEEVRDAFLDGRTRDAWSKAVAQRGIVPLETANDYLLCIEVARACSAIKLSMALVRQGLSRFPSDPFLQLYQSRVLLARNRFLEAIDFLLARESTLGQSHRAWWGTQLGDVYGTAGFERTSQHWLNRVADDPMIDSPLALYIRSCAHEGLQRWDEAIDLAKACVEAAPRWSRARGYLAHCLLARGRIDEASEQLHAVADLGLQESMVDVSRAMLSLSLGQFSPARLQLQQILDQWPQADFIHWIRRTLGILLVEQGDSIAARQLIKGLEERYALTDIPDQLTGRHKYLPMPVIAQNRNQCVPTTVAMAAYPQGRQFNPDELFREMHGREGTQLWRMREWCHANDFEVVPVRLEVDAIREMIDHNVPLIGVLEGPFNSHVDVVCGYNDDLEVLYVRDPSHWAVISYPVDLALERYKMHIGVLAVLSRERRDFQTVLQHAQSFHSVETQALLDLARAVSTGDREMAEQAYARIADDSPAAFLSESYAVNVAASPQRFYQRMKEICLDPEAPSVSRFRAAMSLRPEDGKTALQSLIEDQKKSLGIHGLKYLNLVAAMQEGRWNDARELIERLLMRGANIAYFWELKSDILAELGDHEGSRDALEKAVELEPLRSSVREKLLSRDIHRIQLVEFLREFETIMQQDPDDKRLLLSRVRFLEDSPDGREFERACFDAMKWFPRSPGVYHSLLSWYQFQGRSDLHDRLLQQAREMLPDEFGEDQKAESTSQTAARSSDSSSEEASDSDDSGGSIDVVRDKEKAEVAESKVSQELPSEPAELMNLAWIDDSETGRAALEKLLKLQSNGSLHWYEQARLTALRLLKISSGSMRDIPPQEVLPDQPAGAAHWFVDLCLDVLTDGTMSVQVAEAVDEWSRRLVPNYDSYPELWFKRVLVLEQAGRMEEALVELHKLVEKFPAFASGMYRMGVVKFQQRDFTSARKYFQQALDVNPGLVGAIHMLREVCQILGDLPGVLHAVRRQRMRFPYSYEFLRDEARATADVSGNHEDAIEVIRRAAADFPQQRLRLLEADVLMDAGRVDEAGQIIEEIPLDETAEDDLFELVLRAWLRLAMLREDTARIDEICETGLRRWPDSTLLLEVKADLLQKSDPQAAREYLRRALYTGDPQERTARAILATFGGEFDRHAREIVMGAPTERQQALAELFIDAFGESQFLRWATPYLEWAVKQFPDSVVLNVALIDHYNISGRTTDAVILAEGLYQRDPQDLASARTFGRAMIDEDPERAISILEKVAERSRSVEVLFDLARAHQLVGKTDVARELHAEILDLNPYVAASWANLFFMGTPKEELWERLIPILEQGVGIQDQYFLAAAVVLAHRLKRILPMNWFPMAVERWRILKTYPPFRDEDELLKKALAAWISVRPGDQLPYPDLRFGWWTKFWARIAWPGTTWIPRE